MSHTLTVQDLRQFTGTEKWYRHWASRTFLFTEGVHYVAEHGEAFWLIDEIVFAQKSPAVKHEEFQVWKLTVKDRAATLVCEDGNYHTVWTKQIKEIDFPLPNIEFYFENDVLYLPSER